MLLGLQQVPAPGDPVGGQVIPEGIVGHCEALVHAPPRGEMHLPPLQVLLAMQQSVGPAQAPPGGLHAQAPLVHAPEQQSEACPQVFPERRQHLLPAHR
jgi:hypothetical protein